MEESGFAMERSSFKRRLTETQVATNSGGSDNKVGNQMRRVHIVYFLCRNGRIEHPHLIRVHHHYPNGVHLRDVKRWLSELRGKDMPLSFAWSYKRRYKEGYVWQDLLNDDLITPICDNEYVLKGSEISSRTLNNEINSLEGKEAFELKTSPPFKGKIKGPNYPSMRKEYFLDFSTNTSIEIEESSFGSNVTTEDTTKNQDGNKDKEVIQTGDDENKNNLFYETFSKDKNSNKKNNNESKKGGDKSETSSFKANLSPTNSVRKSGQKSNMFRNWITCGTANTHEEAMVVIKKRNGSISSTFSSVSEKNGKENNMGKICKEQKLRGFEKGFDTNAGLKKSKEDTNNLKSFGAAYKPFNGPNCSQCGKQFKPEKLHNHMKYCRGMKAMAKSTNSRLEPKTRPHSPSSISMDTFFLTNN